MPNVTKEEREELWHALDNLSNWLHCPNLDGEALLASTRAAVEIATRLNVITERFVPAGWMTPAAEDQPEPEPEPEPEAQPDHVNAIAAMCRQLLHHLDRGDMDLVEDRAIGIARTARHNATR